MDSLHRIEKSENARGLSQYDIRNNEMYDNTMFGYSTLDGAAVTGI
jgi:hypothetical protein